MKKTIINPGTVLGCVILLAAIGYTGGYCAAHWWQDWKRKNTKVLCRHHARPAIYDRSGVLLVGNREQTQPHERLRYNAIDGKFAAGLLGFTEFSNGREIGRSGIEKMINSGKTPGTPIYISIDCGVQKTLEGWMDNLAEVGPCRYMYAICLNSQGELLAAAQRPVLDINNRQQVEGGTCLFPAVYVIPIPDDFMKLLGSSTDAEPEAKAVFRFHHKIGIFSPEARGRVRGINAPADAPDAQTATAFNYLLAYISAAENKPIPPLQIFSSGQQPPIVMKEKIEWLKIQQEKNNIIALGKAPGLTGDWLYFLICIEPQKREIFQKIIAETSNFS